MLGVFLKFVPKNYLSWLVGYLVLTPLPWPLSVWSVKWFVGRYKINMQEAELDSYPSIGALFTRKLKSGVRPIQGEIVHPVDGRLTESGLLDEGKLLQIKGRDYGLKALLAGRTGWKSFLGGSWRTYYLCPTDYHRVHSPVTGSIVSVTHVPGQLWPVNAWSVSRIDNLFVVNERVIVWIQTLKGPVAVIFVGATNVGKITLIFDPEVVTNQWPFLKELLHKNYPSGLPTHVGDELGVFNMGSTVIVLFGSGYKFESTPGGVVRMGESVPNSQPTRGR